MNSPVVHWEFWSRQPQEITEFYEKAFGWKINLIPEMNYRSVVAGEGGVNGGIFEPEEGPLPGNMALYMNTDNLEEARERVVAAGGKIVVEEQEVPGMGRFALFSDPEGRVNGIWEGAEQPDGEKPN